MSHTLLPSFLQPFFWSYRLEDLDVHTHKGLIIKQILNHGSKDAIDWLLGTYTADEIQSAIAGSMVTEWSKKSLSLWSKVYNTHPTRHGRFA